MTLASAPWALDGARTEAALARAASYAETGGAEGVITPGDLKVTALAVPGVGIQIASGGALVLNRYQASPRETYTVRNIGDAALDSTYMPPVSASAQSHLVCVTVGDPEFSQVGHPWMTSDAIPEEEVADYQYVRFFVIPNVPSTTKTFKQLGLSYPAVALARIDVPANTTTIQSNMIVDLRKVARPRRHEEIVRAAATASEYATYSGWKATTVTANVDIPEWATAVNIQGNVSNLVHEYEGEGELRLNLAGAGVTGSTLIREGNAGTSAFHEFIDKGIGGKIAIPVAARGTTKALTLEWIIEAGTAGAAQGPAFLRVDGNSGYIVNLTFVEEAV